VLKKLDGDKLSILIKYPSHIIPTSLREQRRILTELISDEEITEATALKLREAINYDEMVIV
jgi:hypothetical protein